MSTGNVATDKARATSVEYWQKTAKNLHAENEELRKQLGVFPQAKGVAVQEVLTQLFVEKVQDVPAVESIIDSPTHGELSSVWLHCSHLVRLTVDSRMMLTGVFFFLSFLVMWSSSSGETATV